MTQLFLLTLSCEKYYLLSRDIYRIINDCKNCTYQ